MSLCSVDFFNTKLEFVYHDEVEITDFDLDYLTPEATQFDISQPNNVAIQNVVRFSGYNNFVGIVDSVQQDEGFTTVSVKPFMMLFDHAVLFDTDWQFDVDHYQRTQDDSIVSYGSGTYRSYYTYSYETDEFTQVEIPQSHSNIHPNLKGWYVYMRGDKIDESSGQVYHWTEDRSWKNSKTYYYCDDGSEPGTYELHAASRVSNPRRTGLYEITKKKSLEERIKELIYRYYINPYSKDNEQKVPISFELSSETNYWTFDLVPDQDNDPDNHHAIVEFYDVVLQRSLTQYRVTVEPEIDFVNKCIKLTIGAPTDAKTFEADLPGISVKDLTIGKMESDINKLEIWNSEVYDTGIWDEDSQNHWTWKDGVPNKKNVVYYYLHNSGDHDTDGTRDRITPIKMEVLSCAPEREFNQVDEEELSGSPKDHGWWEQSESGSGYCRTRDTQVKQVEQTDENGCVTMVNKTYYISNIKKPFHTVAMVQAREKFSDIQHKNHVELEILPSMFDSANMRIGTKATIYYKGKSYDTILTGKKVGDTVTLIFGTIRIDYTKKTQLSNSSIYSNNKTVNKKSNTSSR